MVLGRKEDCWCICSESAGTADYGHDVDGVEVVGAFSSGCQNRSSRSLS